jgi:chromosome segregation ATPase
LRQELQQKAWAFAQQQATVENLAQNHRSQIQKLEAQISEYQHSRGQNHAELEKANAQVAAMRRRIEELQGALQHAELTGLSRVEQIRQEYTARLDTLSAELAEKNLELQQHASSHPGPEQAGRDEIDRLIAEAEERNQILQNRNDELVRVKAQLDELLERHAQLESTAAQAESAAMAEAERMRTEFHAQLALLQAELSQKEWALEERQAVASGREMDYRQQLNTLRQQLAEKENETPTVPEKNDQESATSHDVFVMGDPKLTEAQRARLKKLEEMVEAIQHGEDISYPAAPGRRWRTSFGWKRRWKS